MQVQGGAPYLAFSWFISTITRVDLGVISIVNGIYKPTYNWGGTTLYVLYGNILGFVNISPGEPLREL